MDLSALIFVALAVAWAVYLIPKALKHHDEAVRSRSIDRFSHTMRVLARREPVDERSARLVVTPGRPASEARVVTKPRTTPAADAAEPTDTADVPADPRTPRARREAANRAARRRRRVLGGILAVNALVVALAGFALISWWWVAAPVTMLVAWLVACRLMVRGERRLPAARMPMEPDQGDRVQPPAGPRDVPVEEQTTGEIRAVDAPALFADEATGDPAWTGAALTDPALWDPVPVTLPTYVSKPSAGRTVRTIDLDSTGVWTSGRSEVDSRIAREAEAAERAARTATDEDERAVGS